jgi:hypothetical protein
MSRTNQSSVIIINQSKDKKVEYRGLCSTCKRASTCTFPRDPNRPVLQCDEFVGYEYTPDKKKSSSSDSESKVTISDSAKSSYKGLCRLCEKRETCTYPKPEGGVWHCDEYC